MKKQFQSNLDGMTLGGGSIEHPLSIHSASIGTRWKPRGMQLICTLVLLFTFAIGNVWANDYTLAASTFNSDKNAATVDGQTFTLDQAHGGTGQTGYSNYIKFSKNKTYVMTLPTGFTLTNINIKGYTNSNGKTDGAIAEIGGNSQSGKTFPAKDDTNLGSKTQITAGYDFAISQTGGTVAIKTANTNQICVLITITGTPAASGPVDPTASFSNGDYTIGGSDLDLSTLFTTNSEGTVEYSISDPNGTGAALRADGKRFYATTAGTATVAVAQAATSAHNAFNATATITVAACETSISGQPSNASLKVGDANPTLSVTATNVAAYAWKESSDGTSYDGSSTLSTSDSYTPSVNDAVQTKYYYCEVTSSCSGSAVVKSNIVTVEVEAADPPCAELVPATSGDAPAAGGAISLSTATGGSMKALTTNISYTAYGLLFGSSSSTKAEVTLNHLMQVGTVITATIYNDNNDKARGLNLLNSSGTSKATWTKTQTGDHVETYTVVAGDGLAGSNVFQLQRNNNAYLKSITVSNCGAELHALTSAIDPVAADGKATITLSKSLIAEGGTATATYSAIDAAYDFDEWVISGATIDDAQANPVTITMGSTDATITLKLKDASVKHTVTYYDGEAILANKLGEELIEHNDHPTGAALAPHKLGYTFGGWSTTEDGAAATLSDINVTEDMPLYAVWNAVNCATKSGTIYTMSIVVAPLANCTITSTTGTHDLYQYEGVSGGEALLGNKGTSNNCILQTNKKILLKDDNSYIKLDFDCPLKEGDKIVYSVESNNPVVSTGNSKPSTPLATLDRSKTEFVIPAESGLIDAQTIYIWKGGGNTTVTYINIVRPEEFDVTFNLHGHGTPIAPQSVLDGGKVTKPSDPSESGWDFDGWYATYVADPESYDGAWDFDNDVVTAATELHAKWTEHVLSNNVALGTLTVNGEDVAIVPSQLVYAVELPFGTTAIPTVAATAADANAKACNVTQALAVDGSATIYVKAEDNTTEATYTINFSVATSKDIQLVFKTGTTPCVGSASTATQILSNNAAVSTYINQITFTNVEGAGDDGAEGSSLNVGKKAGNMFTLSAKAGYALQSMNFLAKIQDATCEYSINGGAWTELASTNTGGDECYAPFTSGTVHEFRLRSTGNQGVWIRNMQLTMIEACTPIVVAWDEEPVEFEVGKSGYTIAATANNGGTVSYSSESAAVVDVVAATGALTISGLGSATLKAATAEGDGTTYCANGGNDIEISKAVNTYYLVKFDAQNGDATDEVKYYSGDAAIALPAAPTFAGYDFQGWFDAETGGNQYTAAITPAASMTVYAQWVAQCAGATITTQPTGTSYLTGRTATALVCEATAGAGGALTYEWFTCDDAMKTNPVAATAMPSTAVAGTFYYFCKVMEEGCDVEAFSNVVTITVADKDAICLVKAELAPGSSAASITSTSGYYKDDENIAINIKKDLKLGSTGNYVKVAIDGANFQDGDVVEITLASDKTASAWLQIFIDEGTTMVAEMTSGVSREHPNYLTISGVPANTKTLYLYRTEAADGNMNPYPTSMAVYRTCAPILNKVTVAGVDGTPDNTNHIAIEVPFSTLDAALDAIAYDWVSNDAAWTAAHNPAVANAWEWGVENTVTLTDKDNDQSVYYVTISKAVASTDATLSALTVNGQAIALADGVFEYSFELPYGTTVAPTVVATPNHVAAVATVDPCTVNGATITVVPESGAGDQKVYTLTFTISAWKEVVIWDGSTMSAVATSPDATTGFAWSVNGFSSITNYSATCGTKAYTKTLPSGGGASASRNIAFTVPAGYVAKFYIAFGTHSDGNNRGMFIGTTATKTLDETSVLTLYSDSRTNLTDGTSEIVGAGTYYLNPMESEDFYEIRAYLRKGMVRNSMLGNGVLGTSCVDHNVAIEDIQGATFYELMGRDYTNSGKLAFDEIVSGELEAGVPYVFQAHGDKLILFYGDTKVDDPVDKHNGMYGTFTDQTLDDLDDVYYFAQRALWGCADLSELQLPANRAYVKLSEVGDANPTPAPGRRRITMNVNGEKIVTGMENLNASEQPVKLLINGQIFILRGEKMFDATGRLVK